MLTNDNYPPTPPIGRGQRCVRTKKKSVGGGLSWCFYPLGPLVKHPSSTPQAPLKHTPSTPQAPLKHTPSTLQAHFKHPSPHLPPPGAHLGAPGRHFCSSGVDF